MLNSVYAFKLFFIVLCLILFIFFSGKKWHSLKLKKNNPVPERIFQYGIARTATTLQFQILCLLMIFHHVSEIESVGCFSGTKPFHKYTVIKTHSISNFMLQSSPAHSWIFMTYSDSMSTKNKKKFAFDKRSLQNMKFRIPYIADIKLVSKHGYRIVYEYQSIFGISDEQMQHVIEYLRYWDILRKCCGKQMSSDWRKMLSTSKKYILQHDQHGPLYPACEMYNISEVENLMMKTYVYKHFANIPSLHDVIGKPAYADGYIDGHYCERCNKNITLKHLGFNRKCA